MTDEEFALLGNVIENSEHMEFGNWQNFPQPRIVVGQRRGVLVHSIHDKTHEHARIGCCQISAKPIQLPFFQDVISMALQHLIDF
jgi:hypothetical protein